MANGLRVAVIGVGVMGSHHARVYDELPGADLVAVADHSETRIASLTEAHSIRGYQRYAKMLAEEALDAVSIAVPTKLHEDAALACIDRNVAILIEKPLAASVEEGLRIQSAAGEAGVAVQVGHIERFNPAVVALKQHLDAGGGGAVLQVKARRMGPFFARERDVGVVHDLGTHDIDIFRYLVGSEIDNVRAETQSGVKTPHEDALSAVVRFANGVVGTLDVNWLSPTKTRELSVLCERGEFKLDYISQELTYHESSPDAQEDEPGTTILVDKREPLEAELASFLRVATGDEPPRVGEEDAIATMRVVEALIESANRGEPQTVAAGGLS